MTVVVLHDDDVKPVNLGLTVGDFVDPLELGEDGVFDYFSPEEMEILLGGLTEEGEDLNPETGKAREIKNLGPFKDGTQICRTCRERKSIEDFSRYATSKTGRRNYCKDCASRAARR